MVAAKLQFVYRVRIHVVELEWKLVIESWNPSNNPSEASLDQDGCIHRKEC
jgi:hypothetical protein